MRIFVIGAALMVASVGAVAAIVPPKGPGPAPNAWGELSSAANPAATTAGAEWACTHKTGTPIVWAAVPDYAAFRAKIDAAIAAGKLAPKGGDSVDELYQTYFRLAVFGGCPIRS